MKRILCQLLIAGCLWPFACGAEVVKVYTSANFAPLVMENGRGLYPDLIDYLNRRKPGGLTFEMSYLPRKRLQVKLAEGSIDGIVIGMMPQWFDDAAQTKYLWTEPFAGDNFVLVSSSGNPIDPINPASLSGATIGLTRGYVYPGIDEWIARHGLLRQEAVSEEVSFEKLLMGRVDSVIMSNTVVRYAIRQNSLQGKLHIGQVPGQVTERRFLVPHAYAKVYDKLAPVIRALKDDPAWKKTASRYE